MMMEKSLTEENYQANNKQEEKNNRQTILFNEISKRNAQKVFIKLKEELKNDKLKPNEAMQVIPKLTAVQASNIIKAVKN